MEQLASLKSPALQKYLNGVVDGYVGRSTSHIADDNTLKHFPNPSKSRLATEITDIFQQSCQKNDSKHLQSKFGKIPQPIIEGVVTVTTVRIQEIHQESKKRSILAGLPDSLQDFDWSLRVCLLIIHIKYYILARINQYTSTKTLLYHTITMINIQFI
eukprot:550212_1